MSAFHPWGWCTLFARLKSSTCASLEGQGFTPGRITQPCPARLLGVLKQTLLCLSPMRFHPAPASAKMAGG